MEVHWHPHLYRVRISPGNSCAKSNEGATVNCRFSKNSTKKAYLAAVAVSSFFSPLFPSAGITSSTSCCCNVLFLDISSSVGLGYSLPSYCPQQYTYAPTFVFPVMVYLVFLGVTTISVGKEHGAYLTSVIVRVEVPKTSPVTSLTTSCNRKALFMTSAVL